MAWGRHCGGRRRRGAGHHRRPCPRPRPSSHRRPHGVWFTNFGCGTVTNYGHMAGFSDSSDDEAQGATCVGGQGQGAGWVGGQGQGTGWVGGQGQGTGWGGGEGLQPGLTGQDGLLVESVDFKAVDNAQKHHTDEYDIVEGPNPQLVVRRGQQFTIQVVFSRAYDTKKDDLRLVFEIGDDPKPGKGTHVEFVLSDKDEPGHWGAKIDQQVNKTLTITVFTPPNCIVGKWRFKVNVVKKTDTTTSVFSYNHKDPIYVLFNPWCKADTVYMENAKHLEAYVLNENGKLYTGNYYRWTAKPWVFGQFTGKVLDCCMYLLDDSELAWGVRGNPVHVVRKLSAMINVQDEGGVLTGNWSGNYSGGKPPLSWTGSAPILEQFYKEKASVKYGQCWVFSGVLTTVFRALGIPARSITNFESAHDADTNVTIDYHFDKSGNPLKDLDEDSVWNFHVWNEAWMTRPDLSAGFRGWQACDSTPQETSDGEYCCGPCPVKAIKEGEVTVPYDGTFIFAEVNADKVSWIQQSDGSWKKGATRPKDIGRLISTMAIEGGGREDVTLNYKYPEGSPQERAAVKKATNKDGHEDAGVPQPRGRSLVVAAEDVDFEVSFDAENTFVGNDFQMDLRLKNKSGHVRTVEGLCVVSTMFYTGVVADQVAAQPIENLKIKPGETKTVSVKVSESTYHGKLKDCCMLSLSVMARVKETMQTFEKKDNARLRKPHLSIKGPASAKRGREVAVEVSFINPLNKTLTDCYLEVEGPGLKIPRTHPQGEVAAKGTFTSSIKVKPVRVGKKEVVVIFNCHELEDINGTHAINIQQ